MTPSKCKRISPEDKERMRKLAEDLNRERNATVRMAMQQKFVREMTETYGHERSTKLLTQVWALANARKENDEQGF